MIKSNKVYNPRDYLRYVGIEITEEPMNDIPIDFIYRKLKENNKPFWDYPLDFYNNLQNQDPDIVLVDCSYYESSSCYEGSKFVREYRWFEV